LKFILDITNNARILIPNPEGVIASSFGRSQLKATRTGTDTLSPFGKSIIHKLNEELCERFFTRSTDRETLPLHLQQIKIVSHIVLDAEDVPICIALHPCYSSWWFPAKAEEKAQYEAHARAVIRGKLGLTKKENSDEDSDPENRQSGSSSMAQDSTDIALDKLKQSSNV
jgi:hypothetical protein